MDAASRKFCEQFMLLIELGSCDIRDPSLKTIIHLVFTVLDKID